MSQPSIQPGVGAHTPDLELAHRVARGEQDAIRVMVRRHNQLLYRTARSILRDDAEAEDAVQEAYVKAIGAMGGFRAEAKLSTWLVRITANEALERRRRKVRSAEIIRLEADAPAEETAMPDLADDALQPEAAALQSEIRSIVERRIDELPEAFRTVFVLRAVEELSVEETAAALGIPPATVRTRFFRARALLRDSLARSVDLAIDGAFGFAGERCDRILAAVLRRLSQSTPGGA